MGNMFEPTKGLAVICCDETATAKVIPLKPIHVSKEDFEAILNGDQTMTARVEDGYVVLSLS